MAITLLNVCASAFTVLVFIVGKKKKVNMCVCVLCILCVCMRATSVCVHVCNKCVCACVFSFSVRYCYLKDTLYCHFCCLFSFIVSDITDTE